MAKSELILSHSEKAFLCEQKRAETLTDRADKFIGAIAVLAGFQLVQALDLTLGGSLKEAAPGWLTLIGLSLLGIALVLAALSMNVRMYLSYPPENKLFDELKDEQIGEEEARIKLALMYLNAHNHNVSVNNKRGGLLVWSGAFIVAGFSLALLAFLIGRVSFH